MKKRVLLFFFLFMALPAYPQATKVVNQQQGGWLGYLNQTRLSNRWGLWADLHYRHTNFFGQWNQYILRGGLTYYLADNVRLTAGYAYIGTRLSPSGVVRPEHRPWQQIWWSGRSGPLNLVQWVRTEQRLNHRISGDQLGEGYGFNWRFRYNALLQVPLKGQTIQPGVPNLVLQNELFVNAGKQITYNTFDQNRLFVGLSYPFNKQFTGQLGYMNQLIQQPSGNAYVSNNTLRFFLFHNLDLRKKE